MLTGIKSHSDQSVTQLTGTRLSRHARGPQKISALSESSTEFELLVIPGSHSRGVPKDTSSLRPGLYDGDEPQEGYKLSAAKPLCSGKLES